MQRIVEPELMNQAEQALAYAAADFESAHQGFIDLFINKFPEPVSSEVLDLGCGPCDISRRFALAFPATTIHAVDGAPRMLKEAERLNRATGLSQRIKLIEAVLPNAQIPQAHYPTIISNSLLHHLHDPHVLWHFIRQHASPSARIFVMDLMRPDTAQQAQALVDQYAADEPAILRDDFYNSLCAAFTPQEVQQQLDKHDLSQLHVEVTSDRHMIIYGHL